MSGSRGGVEGRGLAEFMQAFKALRQRDANSESAAFTLALLSSFTLRGARETLSVLADEQGIALDVYETDYNQYPREILDSASALYRHDPRLVILFIDAQSLLGDLQFTPYEVSDAERRDWVRARREELGGFVEAIKKHSGATVLLHNLETPSYSPMNILESKQEFGLVESVETVNRELRDQYKTDPRVFVFDYNGFLSGLGKRRARDPKMYFLGDIKLDMQLVPALCAEYLQYLLPAARPPRKCLVVDLDNTLWGGVVGEDGMQGIRLGPTPEGRPFLEFQKRLLALGQRGVILAVNSKNNPDDAMQALREHPHQVLRPEHFACLQINWDDKTVNMRRIAETLNIGLDSLVFLDDDKGNRELMRGVLPEVHVVDLPEDPALYASVLSALPQLNTLQLTEEDRKKGEMYAQQRQREEMRGEVGDLNEYLKRLEIRACVEPANEQSIPRIAQLTQKTNQFNMTTRRYQEADIRTFAGSKSHRVYSVKVEDKFGDNGITGVVIFELVDDTWKIDSFLLSCRVIGRKVEEAFLGDLLRRAKAAGAKQVVGEFIATAKNAPAKNFYREFGFVLRGETGGAETWELELNKPVPMPDCVRLIGGENA